MSLSQVHDTFTPSHAVATSFAARDLGRDEHHQGSGGGRDRGSQDRRGGKGNVSGSSSSSSSSGSSPERSDEGILRSPASSIPKYSLREHGMSARSAKQIVLDECAMDGNPNHNLASFVTSYMEEEAHDILNESVGKNMGDQVLYPACHELQERCVNILASLFHSSAQPPPEQQGDEASSDSASTSGGSDSEKSVGSVGVATVGSSEAVLLAALAMKWAWRQWRVKRKKEERERKEREQKFKGTQRSSNEEKAEGEKKENKQGETQEDVLKGEGWATSSALEGESYGPGSDEPPCNMIISAASHVSLLKACKYFDIQPRIIPLEHGRCTMSPDLVENAINDNTIGVMAIVGNTLTGECDDVAAIHDRIARYNRQHDTQIRIHVDAASAGFILPFTHPDLVWDMRLPLVKSINVSGHKFGQVYPGIGWIVFKQKSDLPADLVFHVNYLGSDSPTYTLNFSRPAFPILLQYYMLLRLGRQGLSGIAHSCMSNARHIAKGIQAMGVFELISANLKERKNATIQMKLDEYAKGEEQGETEGEAEKESDYEPCIPVIVFRLKDDPRLVDELGFDLYDLSHELRTRGWMIPAYSMPKHCDDITVMRIVVRESMSHETCDILLDDIKHHMVDLIHRRHAHSKATRQSVLHELGLISSASASTYASDTDQQKEKETDMEKVLGSGVADMSGTNVDKDALESFVHRHAEEEDECEELVERILGSVQAMRPHHRIKTNKASTHKVKDKAKQKQSADMEKQGKESGTGAGKEGEIDHHDESRLRQHRSKHFTSIIC